MHSPDNKPSTVGATVMPGAQSTPFPNGTESGAAGAPFASGKPAVDDFVNRLVEGAHAAIDKLADAAGPTVDRIAGALSNPSGKASSAGQSGDEQNSWISNVKDIAREHPIATVAVALAAGAIYMKLTVAPSRDPRDGLDD